MDLFLNTRLQDCPYHPPTEEISYVIQGRVVPIANSEIGYLYGLEISVRKGYQGYHIDQDQDQDQGYIKNGYILQCARIYRSGMKYGDFALKAKTFY